MIVGETVNGQALGRWAVRGFVPQDAFTFRIQENLAVRAGVWFADCGSSLVVEVEEVAWAARASMEHLITALVGGPIDETNLAITFTMSNAELICGKDLVLATMFSGGLNRDAEVRIGRKRKLGLFTNPVLAF